MACSRKCRTRVQKETTVSAEGSLSTLFNFSPVL
uniref:Uncharacterized protein n=1 Tax=Anguilla anguilla TaxID=7936 RepID=A0A0E9V907_ANGAN